MRRLVEELIVIKKITSLKILTQEKIMQTSSANSEHKHSEIKVSIDVKMNK